MPGADRAESSLGGDRRIVRLAAVALAVALALPLALALTPTPALAASPDASALSTRYGIGRVRAGAQRWTTSEVTLLGETLQRLHRQELAAVADVDFVRSGLATRPFGSGLFRWDRRGRSITIYSRAFFAHDDRKAPNWTIVHEVGHAIAAWDLVTARRKEKRALDAYNDAVERYNDLVRAYNSAARAGAADAKSRKARVEAEGARLGPLREDALAQKRTVLHQHRQLRVARPQAGVLAEYRQVLGRKRAPTAYGRTSISESFAESFAMYRCEPERLKRLLPEVFRWFSTGEHMARVK